MLTTITLTSPTQALPDTPPPKKTAGLTDVQPKQMSSHHELLFSSSVPHSPAPSIRLRIPGQSTTNSDNSIVPHSAAEEDEYTLSAYGDISLGDIIVPPLPTPTRPNPALQPRNPQPRLRLKVRRPPMPKRRLSYTYIPDPFPYTGGLESDERWPGSPRPIPNSPSWFQHQPLVSPLADPSGPRAQGNKPAKNGSSLEKIVDELLPRLPSIRLSSPGSPVNQVHSLPQETHGQKNADQQGRNLPEADSPMKAPKPPKPPVKPAPQQVKPWRTRLPPRPPIPKWDI